MKLDSTFIPSTMPALRGIMVARAVKVAIAVSGTLGAGLTTGTAAWAAGTTLERPTFDREHTALVLAYRGALPRVTTDSYDGGTRWVASFSSAQARSGVAYKMGLFHPLVTKVEMIPDNNVDRVRVVILLSRPAQLSIRPDGRSSQIHLALLEAEAATLALDTQPGNRAPSEPVRQAVPQALPSAAPNTQSGKARPVPGSPASGQYVYRKIIPGADPRDVTEVEVRSARRKNLDVEDNPNRAGVTLNVTSQDPTADAESRYQTESGGLSLPGGPARTDVSYRPLTAFAAQLGYATLIAERSPALGLDYSGGGSATLGATAHLPLTNQVNALFGIEAFSYTMRYAQLPDAVVSQRTEIWGQGRVEYLAVRKPWVLALGAEYWLRAIRGNHNALSPVLPSLAFASNALWHGPALQARLFYPFWSNLALTVDGAIAPGLLSGGDPSVQLLGNLWGYRAGAGIKWSSRHVALQLGYRHQGLSTYDQVYSASRGGPEVSASWRF